MFYSSFAYVFMFFESSLMKKIMRIGWNRSNYFWQCHATLIEYESPMSTYASYVEEKMKYMTYVLFLRRYV